VNKIKEKKINSIKSQISEITDLAHSSINNNSNKKAIVNKTVRENTLTLTKIVDNGLDNLNNNNEIKNELSNIKFILSKQEKILSDLLIKLSK
jgi:hypothetical protein